MSATIVTSLFVVQESCNFKYFKRGKAEYFKDCNHLKKPLPGSQTQNHSHTDKPLPVKYSTTSSQIFYHGYFENQREVEFNYSKTNARLFENLCISLHTSRINLYSWYVKATMYLLISHHRSSFCPCI
jgi:hypothetical protein